MPAKAMHHAEVVEMCELTRPPRNLNAVALSNTPLPRPPPKQAKQTHKQTSALLPAVAII